MAQHTVQIGGRAFDVICQDGQGPHLNAAAAIMDQEAQKISADEQRITAMQLLLMSGLQLADRVIEAEERVAQLEQNSPAPLLDCSNSDLNIKINMLEAKVNDYTADIARLNDQLKQADSCMEHMLTQLESQMTGDELQRMDDELQVNGDGLAGG